MTGIHIPPEALEAAEIALLDCWESGEGNAGVIVRAAIRAALAAWPGMERIYRSEDEKLFTVILPVPQEKTDAEA